jgi:hypothetical protein
MISLVKNILYKIFFPNECRKVYKKVVDSCCGDSTHGDVRFYPVEFDRKKFNSHRWVIEVNKTISGQSWDFYYKKHCACGAIIEDSILVGVKVGDYSGPYVILDNTDDLECPMTEDDHLCHEMIT